jgi:hypothetical protein
MSAMREKDQGDFDLEAFIDLFDEALTSDDTGVQKTLQHLMVIAALTRHHSNQSVKRGPLRKLFENIQELNRRISDLEQSRYQNAIKPGPYPNPAHLPTWSTGSTQWPPAPGNYPPGTVFAQGPDGQIGDPTNIASSSTTYAWDPAQADMAKRFNGGKIVERVEDLLKDGNYKGSSVGAADVKAA